MTSKKIITRFAPSPTGFLHIGGARTALFNWLFARHHAGEFLLRVEDTDKARSTPEATQAILDGMDWLGLKHDRDIVYQSLNFERHRHVAHKLLESGAAYKCYATDAEIDDLKIQARTEGHGLRSPYRDYGPSHKGLNKVTYKDKAAPFTIRFRVPDGRTSIQDLVQGQIVWDNSNFDDLVLLRADGTPT